MKMLTGTIVLVLALLFAVQDAPAQTKKSGTEKKDKSTAVKEKAGSKESAVKDNKSKAKKETAAKETEKGTKKEAGRDAKKDVAIDQTGSRSDEKDEVVGKTADGKSVYSGSRGGHYYLGGNGAKTYVKEFEGAKIVGKTKDGSSIYEGPRGGRYYYNSNGNKTYVPKDK